MKLASREVVRDPFTGTKLVNVLQNDIDFIYMVYNNELDISSNYLIIVLQNVFIICCNVYIY